MMYCDDGIVEFWENQRFWGLTWGVPLLPFDWPAFSDAQGNTVQLARPPEREGERGWFIVRTLGTDEEGWRYSTVFSKLTTPRPGGRSTKRSSDYVRSRVWRKLAADAPPVLPDRELQTLASPPLTATGGPQPRDHPGTEYGTGGGAVAAAAASAVEAATRSRDGLPAVATSGAAGAMAAASAAATSATAAATNPAPSTRPPPPRLQPEAERILLSAVAAASIASGRGGGGGGRIGGGNSAAAAAAGGALPKPSLFKLWQLFMDLWNDACARHGMRRLVPLDPLGLYVAARRHRELLARQRRGQLATRRLVAAAPLSTEVEPDILDDAVGQTEAQQQSLAAAGGLHDAEAAGAGDAAAAQAAVAAAARTAAAAAAQHLSPTVGETPTGVPIMLPDAPQPVTLHQRTGAGHRAGDVCDPWDHRAASVTGPPGRAAAAGGGASASTGGDMRLAADQGLMPDLTDPGTLLTELVTATNYSRAAYGYVMAAGHLNSLTKLFTMLGSSAHFNPITGASAEANLEAIHLFTGIPVEDVVMAEWRSSVFRPCHYLAVDRRRRRLVLAVRGSLELADIATDLTARPVEYDFGGGLVGHVHQGLMSAASYVQLNTAAALRSAAERFPGWPLLVTGHSLGAGVAALLTLLLLQRASPMGAPPAVPAVHCLAIAPPAVLSANLAEAARGYVVSVINQGDFVARLSCYSVDRALLELVQASPAAQMADTFLQSTGATLAAIQQRLAALGGAAAGGLGGGGGGGGGNGGGGGGLGYGFLAGYAPWGNGGEQQQQSAAPNLHRGGGGESGGGMEVEMVSPSGNGMGGGSAGGGSRQWRPIPAGSRSTARRSHQAGHPPHPPAPHQAYQGAAHSPSRCAGLKDIALLASQGSGSSSPHRSLTPQPQQQQQQQSAPGVEGAAPPSRLDAQGGRPVQSAQQQAHGPHLQSHPPRRPSGGHQHHQQQQQQHHLTLLQQLQRQRQQDAYMHAAAGVVAVEAGAELPPLPPPIVVCRDRTAVAGDPAVMGDDDVEDEDGYSLISARSGGNASESCLSYHSAISPNESYMSAVSSPATSRADVSFDEALDAGILYRAVHPTEHHGIAGAAAMTALPYSRLQLVPAAASSHPLSADPSGPQPPSRSGSASTLGSGSGAEGGTTVPAARTPRHPHRSRHGLSSRPVLTAPPVAAVAPATSAARPIPGFMDATAAGGAGAAATPFAGDSNSRYAALTPPATPPGGGAAAGCATTTTNTAAEGLLAAAENWGMSIFGGGGGGGMLSLRRSSDPLACRGALYREVASAGSSDEGAEEEEEEHAGAGVRRGVMRSGGSGPRGGGWLTGGMEARWRRAGARTRARGDRGGARSGDGGGGGGGTDGLINWDAFSRNLMTSWFGQGYFEDEGEEKEQEEEEEEPAREGGASGSGFGGWWLGAMTGLSGGAAGGPAAAAGRTVAAGSGGAAAAAATAAAAVQGCAAAGGLASGGGSGAMTSCWPGLEEPPGPHMHSDTMGPTPRGKYGAPHRGPGSQWPWPDELAQPPPARPQRSAPDIKQPAGPWRPRPDASGSAGGAKASGMGAASASAGIAADGGGGSGGTAAVAAPPAPRLRHRYSLSAPAHELEEVLTAAAAPPEVPRDTSAFSVGLNEGSPSADLHRSPSRNVIMPLSGSDGGGQERRRAGPQGSSGNDNGAAATAAAAAAAGGASAVPHYLHSVHKELYPPGRLLWMVVEDATALPPSKRRAVGQGVLYRSATVPEQAQEGAGAGGSSAGVSGGCGADAGNHVAAAAAAGAGPQAAAPSVVQAAVVTRDGGERSGGDDIGRGGSDGVERGGEGGRTGSGSDSESGSSHYSDAVQPFSLLDLSLVSDLMQGLVSGSGPTTSSASASAAAGAVPEQGVGLVAPTAAAMGNGGGGGETVATPPPAVAVQAPAPVTASRPSDVSQQLLPSLAVAAEAPLAGGSLVSVSVSGATCARVSFSGGGATLEQDTAVVMAAGAVAVTATEAGPDAAGLAPVLGSSSSSQQGRVSSGGGAGGGGSGGGWQASTMVAAAAAAAAALAGDPSGGGAGVGCSTPFTARVREGLKRIKSGVETMLRQAPGLPGVPSVPFLQGGGGGGGGGGGSGGSSEYGGSDSSVGSAEGEEGNGNGGPSGASSGGQGQVQGQWVFMVEADRDVFDRMVLIPASVTDHLPDAYFQKLRQLAKGNAVAVAAAAPAAPAAEPAAAEAGGSPAASGGLPAAVGRSGQQ